MTTTINFTHDGRVYSNWEPASAYAAGVPVAIIGAALKAQGALNAASIADGYRARLDRASAGKLAEYRIKEEIARDPNAAPAEELAMLDREAAARGLDRAALLAEISAKAASYRQTALLIGALEAETKAAISGIADDAADIEARISTAMAAARAQADTAFADAMATIHGGS